MAVHFPAFSAASPLSFDRSLVPPAYRARRKAPVCTASPPLLEKRQVVARILRRDLLRQYDAPRQLDWSIYDDSVTFDDPFTEFSGKLPYKGMILTIAIVVKLLFKRNSARFSLHDCHLTEDGDKVRTRFDTVGLTKWNAQVRISGEDFFWFGHNSDKIVRHQSSWDQTPQQIRDSFRPPSS